MLRTRRRIRTNLSPAPVNKAQPLLLLLLVFLAIVASLSPVVVVNSFTPLMPTTINSYSRQRARTTAINNSRRNLTPLKESANTRTDSLLPDYGKTSVEIDKIQLDDKKTTASKNNNKWRRSDLFGNSLIEDTLLEMENDLEFQRTKLKYETLGASAVTKQERTRRRRALTQLGVPSFAKYATQQVIQQQQQHDKNDNDGDSTSTSDANALNLVTARKTPAVLQINIGLYCNQACSHCHVESSPLRTAEQMNIDTVVQCLRLLKNNPSITTLDITGGAPELNENFRYLVSTARDLRPDLDIIDRCNLSVLQEPGQEDLVEFLVSNRVRIVASLPCYSQDNVDEQRGRGVFERSISALIALNDAGYGIAGSGLVLDLVYNPLGAFLPPPQDKLEQQYKTQLRENFGIQFNSLYTMTNMPIKRFADFLFKRDELQDYMDLLVRNFNVDTITNQNLMCHDTVSVDWTGKLYDCDFNQQLGYGLGTGGISSSSKVNGSNSNGQDGLSVFDINNLTEDLQKYKIRTDNHCFGCTAGMGSS